MKRRISKNTTIGNLLRGLLAVGILLASAFAQAHDHYGKKQVGYDGIVNTTVTNKTCHTWSKIAEVGPNKYRRMNAHWKATYNGASLPNHNFCRNPDNSDKAWCYVKGRTTTGVENGEYNSTWEYCDVDAPPPARAAPIITKENCWIAGFCAAAHKHRKLEVLSDEQCYAAGYGKTMEEGRNFGGLSFPAFNSRTSQLKNVTLGVLAKICVN